MLRSGMNLKPNILKSFSRRTLWIFFILFVSVSFSTSGVIANSCKGGADCLNCAAAAHPHLPGMDVEMVNQGCQSTEQNRSCGFEAGHSADDFDRIATIVTSGTHSYSGIFSIASDESDQAHLHLEFLTQFQYPDRGELTPIFLLNQSLLC